MRPLFRIPDTVFGSSRPSNPARAKFEYISLHVQDDLKSGFQDPVKDLESISEADSLNNPIKKLNMHYAWQPTRLLVTARRLYMLSPMAQSHEIVDSIPLHEIACISDIDEVLKKLFLNARSFARRLLVRSRGDSSLTAANVPNISNYSNVSLNSLPDECNQVSARANEAPAARSMTRSKTIRADSAELQAAFEVRTKPDGFNQGTTFYFTAGSPEAREYWLETLSMLSRTATMVYARKNRIRTIQGYARSLFQRRRFQIFVVAAITANFIITLAESQLGSATCGDGPPTAAQIQKLHDNQEMFNRIDTIFTIIFLAELAFNFGAHAFWPFFENRWNLFDTFVVLTSLAFLFVSATNNGLVKLLRILRVFRVLRLFGRIGQLREIVYAVTRAIIPTSQALFIGLILIAIYAAIGYQYFAEERPEGFCDFFHAYYTMFSVVAYQYPDGLDAFDDQGNLRHGHLAFIYSFICIGIFVYLQVVVAVLMDSFNRARWQEKQQVAKEDAAAAAASGRESEHPLDLLLSHLLSSFETGADLDDRLDLLFVAFDVNRSRSLSHVELAAGLFKLYRVKIRTEQFEAMALRVLGRPPLPSLAAAAAATPGPGSAGGGVGVVVANSMNTVTAGAEEEEPELGPRDFRAMMRGELREFVQRRLAVSLFLSSIGAEDRAVLTALKLAMTDLDRLQGEIDGLFDEMGRADALERQLRQQGRDIDAVLLAVGEGLVKAPPPPGRALPAPAAPSAAVAADAAPVTAPAARRPPGAELEAVVAAAAAGGASPSGSESARPARRVPSPLRLGDLAAPAPPNRRLSAEVGASAPDPGPEESWWQPADAEAVRDWM